VGIIAIRTVSTATLAKETARRIVLEFAICGRSRTLALEVKAAHFLSTVVPVGGLGLRAWCFASLGLVLAGFSALSPFGRTFRGLGFVLGFASSLSPVRDGQGVAARKVLTHLGTSPFKPALLEELPHHSHESLVVALVAADFETFVVPNVVTQRVRFSQFSQDERVLHVVIWLVSVLNAGQH
jgi:hypothetical protein